MPGVQFGVVHWPVRNERCSLQDDVIVVPFVEATSLFCVSPWLVHNYQANA